MPLGPISGGVASGGGGNFGGGGGGVPAAHLPQDNDATLGLFIGLENETAGPDWLLDMMERNVVEVLPKAALSGSVGGSRLELEIPADYERPSISTGGNWFLEVVEGNAAEVPDVAAVAATATFNFASSIGPTSIVITMPTEIATGGDGNDWRIRFLADDNNLASPVVITIDESSQIISIQKHAAPSVTWGQIITAMNAAIGAGSTVATYGSDPGSLTASSNSPLNIPALGAAATNKQFSGGADAYNLDTPAQINAVTLTGSSRTITINFPTSLGVGTFGNGWRFILAATDGSRQGPTPGNPARGWTFDVNNGAQTITARRGLGNTADNLAAALNAEYGAGTGVAGGSGAQTLDNGQQDLGLFSGGETATPPRPRDPISLVIDRRDSDPSSPTDSGGNFVITALQTDTLAEIVAVINGFEYEVRYGDAPLYERQDAPYTTKTGITATIVGAGTNTLLQSLFTVPGSGTFFSQGQDIEPIHGSIDQDAKIVTLHYNTGDSLADLKAFLNGEELFTEHTTLLAVEIAETDLTRDPIPHGSANIPFVNYYSQGSFPGGSRGGGGGASDAALNNALRLLQEAYNMHAANASAHHSAAGSGSASVTFTSVSTQTELDAIDTTDGNIHIVRFTADVASYRESERYIYTTGGWELIEDIPAIDTLTVIEITSQQDVASELRTTSDGVLYFVRITTDVTGPNSETWLAGETYAFTGSSTGATLIAKVPDIAGLASRVSSAETDINANVAQLNVLQGGVNRVEADLAAIPRVTANPSAAATTALTKIQVGNVVYSLPTGTTPSGPSDEFVFGLSADAIPTPAEGTITAPGGSASIGPIANQYILIFRQADQGDITSVVFSDDPTSANQFGAFDKYASQVTPSGETGAYNVWVSTFAITRGVATMEVS